MKKLLIPLVMVLAGLGAGIGAGLLLGPDPGAGDEHAAAAVECIPVEQIAAADLPPEPATPSEFVRFHNQFMIPILQQDVVESLIVLSISVEVTEGQAEAVFSREPRLRDSFLQILFDHASAGGFQGNFLNSVSLDSLRIALKEAAIAQAGPAVRDVLIVDLVKQDV